MAKKDLDEPSEDVVAKAKKDSEQRRGPFGRMSLFIRQVINELKKVVTPTKRELFRFTLIVLVFVVIMMGIVSALDFGFSALVNFLFGNPNLVI